MHAFCSLINYTTKSIKIQQKSRTYVVYQSYRAIGCQSKYERKSIILPTVALLLIHSQNYYLRPAKFYFAVDVQPMARKNRIVKAFRAKRALTIRFESATQTVNKYHNN